jgi:hypothetical protein
MKKNPHQFIERLLARTMGKEDSGISIKPAITPDVLSEAYHLPVREQQFSTPSPSILPSPSSSIPSSSIPSSSIPSSSIPSSSIPSSSIPSDSQEAPVASLGSSPSQDSSKLPKHTPDVPEEENTIPPNDLRTDDASALSFQEDDIPLFETNVENHNGQSTKASKDKNKNKKTDRQIIPSEESNKLDQKRKIIYPEKVYKQQHVPSQLEYVEGTPASNVKNQEGNQIKQSQEGSLLLSPVSPEIYHPMQVTRQRQNLETSQRYSEQPSVTINIGRIDVRATIPQKPSTKTQKFSPSLSLEDYLKQRSEVSR